MTVPKHLWDVRDSEAIWGPPEVIRSQADFRPYQHWMADVVLKQRFVYLGAEMGLGKTAASLLAASILLDLGVVNRVLVIAPLRVAEETWPSEIAAWAFARHLRYQVVTGTQEERLAALAIPDCPVTIVNRENLRWLYKHFTARRWPFDMIIYDEVSRLKAGRLKTALTQKDDGTYSGGRDTELGILDKIRHKVVCAIGLSGTPAPKGLIDLWGPTYYLDGGKRLGSSFTAYKDRWFKTSAYDYSVTPHEHSEAEIMERLQGLFYSLREEDYLSLPPMIEMDHVVRLPPAVMKQYRSFERESAIWLRDGENDPEIIKAVNNGVLTNKLLQFANGSLYREDGSDIKVHDAKIAALESIISEANGRPILCAYSFKFDKAAILKKFPKARVFGDTPNDMRDWNAGKIDLLLTHPASAGHGLNFQHGSNIAVWYGLTWSMELYRQFIKRLHRSGQKADRVYLHRIIAAGTADEDVVRVLRDRTATQDRITDAVRVRLRKVA